MKIIMKLAVYAILIMMIGLGSCQKDNAEYEAISNKQEIKDIEVIYYNNGKGQQMNMLAFKDFATFRMTIEELANDVRQHDEAFITKYSHLSEEEINEKDIEENFDINKPLKDFEKKLGFISALNNYLEAENEWLRTEYLDMEKDPDILFNYLNEEEIVLLNKNLAVKIGESVFIQKKDGKIKIEDGNLETLKTLLPYNEISQINLSDFDNVSCQLNNEKSGNKANCIPARTNTKYWSNGTKYKMKGKTRFTSNDYWHGTQVYAKTKYYKKGWMGIWRAYRTSISVRILGNYDVYLPAPPWTYDPCGIGAIYKNYNADPSNSSSMSKGYYYSPYEVVRVEHNKLRGKHKASTLNEEQYFY